jgi:hypothetical protein
MARFKVAVAAVGLSLIAGVAFAQSTGGVKVGGNVNMNTVAGSANNIAIGEGNKAKQQIGGVTGAVEVKGNLNQNTVAGSANNIAIGKNNKACQSIGAISSDASC